MHATNPSKIRAAAHRAMALAALHANSSLATRLSRYNAHMSKARALEAAGGCPMSILPGFALPEDLLCVSQDAEAGLPIDAITCALDRADSVLMLLEDHLDGDKPLLSNRVLSSVIWDVRGTLGLIKTLTMYGDASSVPVSQKGGAL